MFSVIIINPKMKVYITFLFFIFLQFSSCVKKSKKDFYYPNKQKFENVLNKDTINILSFSSFKEFKSEMWNFYRNKPDKNPVLLIENEDKRYFIKYIDEIGCMPPIYKMKNLIAISKDSVYKLKKYYSIDSLASILETDLLNYGKNTKYSDNPKSLRIQFLHPEKESIVDLKNSLLNIFTIYNKINLKVKDSIELNIEFQELMILKPFPY